MSCVVIHCAYTIYVTIYNFCIFLLSDAIFAFSRSLQGSEKHDRGKMHSLRHKKKAPSIYEWYLYHVYIKGVRERIVMCTVCVWGGYGQCPDMKLLYLVSCMTTRRQ